MASLRSSSLLTSKIFRSCFNTSAAFSRNYSASKYDPPIDSVDEPQIHIPPYIPRQGEPIDVIKARLLYQSRKRGMLENGLLLSTFASKYLQLMTDEELRDYDRLINLPSNDWDIFYWATGVKPIPVDFDTPIMKKFVAHVRNSDREARFRQPDLNEPASH